MPARRRPAVAITPSAHRGAAHQARRWRGVAIASLHHQDMGRRPQRHPPHGQRGGAEWPLRRMPRSSVVGLLSSRNSATRCPWTPMMKKSSKNQEVARPIRGIWQCVSLSNKQWKTAPHRVRDIIQDRCPAAGAPVGPRRCQRFPVGLQAHRLMRCAGKPEVNDGTAADNSRPTSHGSAERGSFIAPSCGRWRDSFLPSHWSGPPIKTQFHAGLRYGPGAAHDQAAAACQRNRPPARGGQVAAARLPLPTADRILRPVCPQRHRRVRSDPCPRWRSNCREAMQTWRRRRLPSQARQPPRPAGSSETASFSGLHLTQLMLREVREVRGNAAEPDPVPWTLCVISPLTRRARRHAALPRLP